MIFINPRTRNTLGIFSHFVPVSVPLGIGYLEGYLRDQGVTTTVIDEAFEYIERIDLGRILEKYKNPYIFGFSCLTANIGRAYFLARYLKRGFPESIVVFGGIHPTVLPEEVLSHPEVNIVVRREGEQTLLKLYRVLKERKDFKGIEGISFRNSKGKIVHNKDASFIEDLSILPVFPYELFPVERYDLGFISSSRGCPYQCIFCSQRAISGIHYRYAPADKVIHELDILVNKYNQKAICFFDDNFLLHKERVYQLCDSLVARGFQKKAQFNCQTRGDNVTLELLQCIKRAGFTSIGFGLETASERLMKFIYKGETVQDNIRAVHMARSLGFKINASFIFGLPAETPEERRATFRMARELDIDYAKFNNATPYPGTRLYDIAVSEGRLRKENNWENFNSVGVMVESPFRNTALPYCPENLTEKRLRYEIMKANLLFYLRKEKLLQFFANKGGPQWFVLPQRWYFSIQEWYYLVKLITDVSLNLLKAGLLGCMVCFEKKEHGTFVLVKR